MTRAAPALALLLLTAPALGAGRYTLPLAAPDLPAGTLTVKVVEDGMGDIKVGQPVALYPAGDAAAKPLKEVATGADGRARFEGLKPESQVVIVVKVGVQSHRSAALTIPASGGLRMLLTLGDAGPPAGTTPEGAMPPGHPPVAESEPHQEPAGAAEIEAVAALPAGQIEVVVRKGASKRPQAGAEVQIVRAGGKGPQGVVARGRSDVGGKASLQLPEGSGTRYVVQVSFSGLTYTSRAVARPAGGGLRAAFVVYDRTTDLTKLALAPGSHWICQIGERVVRFMQVLRLTTKDELIVDPGQRTGLALPLPVGAEGVELPKDLQGILVHDPARPGKVWLRAPIPPMGLTIQLYYSLPYSGASLDFEQRMPLALPRSVLRVMDNAQVRVEGPSVAGPEDDPGATTSGQTFGLEPAPAGRSLSFTFRNLPHRDTSLRTMALLLVGLIALWGLIAAVGGPGRARALARRREQLLDQLVRARIAASKKGQKKSAQRQITALKQELAQIWEEPW